MTDIENGETFSLTDKPGSGQLIKGRYKLQEELGKGGMGVVYLAHDTLLHNRPVVIKVLRDSNAEEWTTKKFRQEIEALVRIEHPGVVGIFDSGEMPNGQLFVVMQFVEGVNLRSILNSEKKLTFEQASRIVEQIGRALTAAHNKGVLHCDLKPENIMLQKLQTGEEVVKLIDFGIAKIRDSKVTSVEPTKVAGTMEYMAPEQLNGAPTTSSDIFSLGVIAYEILTGTKPFPATTLFQLFEAHRTGVKETPTKLRPELPEAAETAILKALSPDPANRHEKARDFGDELSRALNTNVIESPATYALPRQPDVAQQGVTTQFKKKRLSPLTLGINGVLLLVAISIAWMAFRSGSKSPVTITPASPPPSVQQTVPIPQPELGLTYYMMMKKTASKNEKPFRLPKEVLFEKNHRVQLFVTAPQAGYLYLINEGPGGFVTLFPSTLTNEGSGRLTQNQTIQIPGKDWFVFDAEEGTEKVWVVFSPKEVAELEPLKSVANAEKRGVVDDPSMVQSLNTFFKSHPPDKTEFKRDLENHQTLLKAKTDPLVYLLLLEHH
jgi:serine/threonine protein kinase